MVPLPGIIIEPGSADLASAEMESANPATSESEPEEMPAECVYQPGLTPPALPPAELPHVSPNESDHNPGDGVRPRPSQALDDDDPEYTYRPRRHRRKQHSWGPVTIGVVVTVGCLIVASYFRSNAWKSKALYGQTTTASAQEMLAELFLLGSIVSWAVAGQFALNHLRNVPARDSDTPAHAAAVGGVVGAMVGGVMAVR
jgi:hypothetical protein